MYLKGRGVPKDDEKAANWFKLAAQQGYALAQNKLSMMYEAGVNVP
jgi:TPR repeat protein